MLISTLHFFALSLSLPDRDKKMIIVRNLGGIFLLDRIEMSEARQTDDT